MRFVLLVALLVAAGFIIGALIASTLVFPT